MTQAEEPASRLAPAESLFATQRRLVLWRHGRTDWNRSGRAQGHTDISLDSVGRAQARKAAGFLACYRPDLVWSSDLTRARETAAELVALTGHRLVLDKRLREVDVGDREGMTFAEFGEAMPDLFARFMAGEQDLRVPGGEVQAEVCERMVAVLEDAANALCVGQTGVLVGHGAALRMGLLAFFGLGPGQREMLAGMANCAWAVLEDRAGRGWQIMDYNAKTLPEPLELVNDVT
ncbi:MAG: histidine phosphatase family protein [Nocardioidaceae bacterium]